MILEVKEKVQGTKEAERKSLRAKAELVTCNFKFTSFIDGRGEIFCAKAHGPKFSKFCAGPDCVIMQMLKMLRRITK